MLASCPQLAERRVQRIQVGIGHVAVRLGYLPPDWIMITLGAGLTAVRAARQGGPDSPREIRRAPWA